MILSHKKNLHSSYVIIYEWQTKEKESWSNRLLNIAMGKSKAYPVACDLHMTARLWRGCFSSTKPYDWKLSHPQRQVKRKTGYLDVNKGRRLLQHLMLTVERKWVRCHNDAQTQVYIDHRQQVTCHVSKNLVKWPHALIFILLSWTG